MSQEGKPTFNPLLLPFRCISWLCGKLEDTVLIGIGILLLGLFVIGGMFLIGQLTPKPHVVNKDHVFHNHFGMNNDFTNVQPAPVYNQYQTQHHQVQQSHFDYPANVYHTNHHVQSYGVHHPSHQVQHLPQSHHYQRYNHHLAARTYHHPASSHQPANVQHYPNAVHKFGNPRGYNQNNTEAEYNGKSYDFSNPGGAHAIH